MQIASLQEVGSSLPTRQEPTRIPQKNMQALSQTNLLPEHPQFRFNVFFFPAFFFIWFPQYFAELQCLFTPQWFLCVDMQWLIFG